MMKAVLPTSKIRRAFNLTKAGFASAALRRETDETIRNNARLHLVERLGKLRGLPQKMGQILSMSDDADTADAFATLTDHAEPVPLEELVGVLRESWGQSHETICKCIDENGIAASLGQVHRTTLKDDRDVAIKIQYPGIRNAIDADLKLLGWISEPMGGLSRGFDLPSYRDAIRTALAEELDYTLEAANQREYAKASSGLGLVVPQVIDELSTERVLVTTWEDGETLEETKSWPKQRRFALARSIMTHFLTMLFDHGLVHADPHAGNYRFRDDGEENGDPKIVLYDYGCVRRIPMEERLALLRLIHDLVNSEASDPYPLFLKLGFDRKTLEPLRHKLPALCHVLFDPFATQGKFNLDNWNKAERIEDILGDDRWNFRISGPARLIFLMRAFHGLVYYLRELSEPVSWSICLKPVLNRHMVAMQSLSLPEPDDTGSTFASLARHLCIRVMENGNVKVKVTLTVDAVEVLENVIDEDVTKKIQQRGIAIPEIVKRARANQYAPQELFELKDGPKTFTVWLE